MPRKKKTDKKLKKPLKKKVKTTAELTKGFEKFIEGKELNDVSFDFFEGAIKKGAKQKDA